MNVKKSVYWSTAHNQWGETGPYPSVSMGPVPAAGEWVRLEVPASLLGFENHGASKFEVSLFDGKVWVDRVGKGGSACIPAVAPARTFPAGDTVWIDDGAWGTSSMAVIDNNQKASAPVRGRIPSSARASIRSISRTSRPSCRRSRPARR